MYHRKSRIALIIVLAATLIIFMLPLCWFYDKPVHVSIDDVGMSLADLQRNESDYSTIFQQPFFCTLKNLHEKTGLRITLYVYEEYENLNIGNLPQRFKEELNRNTDWLQIGFHAQTPEFDGKRDSLSLLKSYNALKDSRIGTVNKLRLHYWYATQKEVDFLKDNGVEVLLSADDDRISYSLPKSVNDRLIREENVMFRGMEYERTDIRIEKTLFPLVDLLKNRNDEMLVIFTHEWALKERINRIKFYLTIWILTIYQCNFIL